MAIDQLPKTAEASNVLESDMTSDVFYYPPLRYFKTMLAIAWAAFAHPFSTTVIDLETGEMRHGVGEDE